MPVELKHFDHDKINGVFAFLPLLNLKNSKFTEVIKDSSFMSTLSNAELQTIQIIIDQMIYSDKLHTQPSESNQIKQIIASIQFAETLKEKFHLHHNDLDNFLQFQTKIVKDTTNLHNVVQHLVWLDECNPKTSPIYSKLLEELVEFIAKEINNPEYEQYVESDERFDKFAKLIIKKLHKPTTKEDSKLKFSRSSTTLQKSTITKEYSNNSVGFKFSSQLLPNNTTQDSTLDFPITFNFTSQKLPQTSNHSTIREDSSHDTIPILGNNSSSLGHVNKNAFWLPVLLRDQSGEVKLNIGSDIYHVHKTILKSSSAYFEKLFTLQEDLKEITLEETFLPILSYMYDSITSLNDAQIKESLHLQSKYQIEGFLQYLLSQIGLHFINFKEKLSNFKEFMENDEENCNFSKELCDLFLDIAANNVTLMSSVIREMPLVLLRRYFLLRMTKSTE